MSKVLFLLPTLLLIPILLPAVPDDTPDGLGMYSNSGGSSHEIHAPPGHPFDVHLLLTNATRTSGVRAWECGIEAPENVVILEWGVRGDWISIGDPPDFIVAYLEPLSHFQTVLLMTFKCMATDEVTGIFYLNESKWDSGDDGVPNYIAEEDINDMVPLHTLPNGMDEPAFLMNPEPVDSDTRTWSEIKTLYR